MFSAPNLRRRVDDAARQQADDKDDIHGNSRIPRLRRAQQAQRQPLGLPSSPREEANVALVAQGTFGFPLRGQPQDGIVEAGEATATPAKGQQVQRAARVKADQDNNNSNNNNACLDNPFPSSKRKHGTDPVEDGLPQHSDKKQRSRPMTSSTSKKQDDYNIDDRDRACNSHNTKKRRSLSLSARSSEVEDYIGSLDLVEGVDTRPRGILRLAGKQPERRHKRVKKSVHFDDETLSLTDSENLVSPPSKHVQSLQERAKEEGFAAEAQPSHAVAQQLPAMDAFAIDENGDGEITQGVLDASLALLDMRCDHRRTMSCPRPKMGPRFLSTTDIPHFHL